MKRVFKDFFEVPMLYLEGVIFSLFIAKHSENMRFLSDNNKKGRNLCVYLL